MDIKGEIIKLLTSVNIEGMDKLIFDLDNLGYYEAPASANRHLNIKGGLALHSYLVYLNMKKLNKELDLRFNDRFLIIVGLLHDVCKLGCYKPNILKNGEVSEARPWLYEDTFPYGHGEKSVWLLEKWINLTDDEVMAIRYHIGPFTYETISEWNRTKEQLIKTPYWRAIMLAHHSDSLASSILEQGGYNIEKYILQNT